MRKKMKRPSMCGVLTALTFLLATRGSASHQAIELKPDNAPSCVLQQHPSVPLRSYQDKLNALKVKYKLMATHGDVDAQLRLGILY